MRKCVNTTLKKNLVLLGILISVTLAGAGFTAATGGGNPVKTEEDKFQIVTSFYPVYIATLNVTDGLEGVEVTNMTENSSGCLHDYQLTAADMRKLEHADVFIINGAGMETFMESILETYPDLTVIDTSEGISLLEGVIHEHVHITENHEELHEAEEHEQEIHGEEGHIYEEDIHDHEESYAETEHNHGEYNGHIWMNPDTYVMQIANIKKGLMKTDEAHAAAYETNANVYIEKVQDIGAELEALGDSRPQEHIVIFHDSYAYLADKLHFHIVHQVIMEEDTSMSAGEIAEIMEEIKENNVSILLAEKQFSDQIPRRIAEETGTKVVIVDSLVSGELNKDAYINGMKENIRILKEELKNG